MIFLAGGAEDIVCCLEVDGYQRCWLIHAPPGCFGFLLGGGGGEVVIF